MTEHYEYPAVLFCMTCRQDVNVKIEERTERLTYPEGEIDVPYMAAICPHCGSIVCSRDLDNVVIADTKARSKRAP